MEENPNKDIEVLIKCWMIFIIGCLIMCLVIAASYVLQVKLKIW
jgi:hypothetical protein